MCSRLLVCLGYQIPTPTTAGCEKVVEQVRRTPRGTSTRVTCQIRLPAATSRPALCPHLGMFSKTSEEAADLYLHLVRALCLESTLWQDAHVRAEGALQD